LCKLKVLGLNWIFKKNSLLKSIIIYKRINSNITIIKPLSLFIDVHWASSGEQGQLIQGENCQNTM